MYCDHDDRKLNALALLDTFSLFDLVYINSPQLEMLQYYLQRKVAGVLIVFLLLVVGIDRTHLLPLRLIKATSQSSDDASLEDIFNSTLGFQKIFAISLPSRTDRRDAVSLAAAFTGLQIDLVDAVTEVNPKTLPPGGEETQLPRGALGCWRSHMDVIRLIVEQNITSALILEDDVDWDLHIKSQMRDFAKASRMLVQPRAGTLDQYVDPSYPRPAPGQKYEDIYIEETLTTKPTTSPYGDISRWDLLWLGHCGAKFPNAAMNENVPLGRVVIPNDQTVAEPHHLQMWFGDDEFGKEYPAHTRVVTRSREGVCTYAYAVSQQGARRMLWELGLYKQDHAVDIMIQYLCDGAFGRQMASCLTAYPTYFQNHESVGPTGALSDIGDHSGGYNNVSRTPNIRWATRVNFRKLAYGETDYIDQFPDSEEKDSSPKEEG